MNASILTTGLFQTLVVLILFEPSFAAPPQEPDNGHLITEDVNIITGLYTREYSLNQDGVVDYKTARQIVISEYNQYWDTVVETREYPLFYWYDPEHDGQFTMWIDQGGHGCSCDFVPYNATPDQQK